jgi:hypothetical protein
VVAEVDLLHNIPCMESVYRITISYSRISTVHGLSNCDPNPFPPLQLFCFYLLASSIAFAAAASKSSNACNGKPLSAICKPQVSTSLCFAARIEEEGSPRFFVPPPGSSPGSLPPPAIASPALGRRAARPSQSCLPG